MAITKTETDLDTLKINYLTQEMYDDALENNQINPNELYLTPVTPPADYVIEEDTEGIWTYRKWNSGIAECWGAQTITSTVTAWGNWYYIVIPGENYPTGLFTSVSIALGQHASNADFVSSARNQTHGSATLSTTTSPDILCIRPTTTNASTMTGYWYVKGRWK